MRLLQGDRKANVDILEADKDSNRESIRFLRDENKELRLKVGQLQRGSASDDGAELEHLEHQVVVLRKRFDDQKSRAQSCRRLLHALKDEVRDLELEGQQPAREDTPLARRIRTLENRLDRAMIKYNEAQGIRRTYDQIVKRLKDERVGFDNQLAALEKTLQAKNKDHEELTLLAGDANHVREMAVSQLEKTRAAYTEERRHRETELRERHQLVALRRQMQERLGRPQAATATNGGYGHGSQPGGGGGAMGRGPLQGGGGGHGGGHGGGRSGRGGAAGAPDQDGRIRARVPAHQRGDGHQRRQ
ncbi:unnamed protein product [Phaeothamnion confervicola]